MNIILHDEYCVLKYTGKLKDKKVSNSILHNIQKCRTAGICNIINSNTFHYDIL